MVSETETGQAKLDPDKELVARAKQELPNRTNAFEELMRRYEKLLYRVCFRIMGNTEDAEDVFQEVMVKAYHGLLKFEYRSSFKTWLFTIAHNTCYSSISKLVKAREFKSLMQQSAPDEHAKMSDADLDSERVLASLSREDRELLTLKYVVELKFDEIAEVCGMGTSAVKMRIYRAVEQLKSKHKTA